MASEAIPQPLPAARGPRLVETEMAVMVIEPNPILRWALREVIHRCDGLRFAAEAPTWRAAISLPLRSSPDLIAFAVAGARDLPGIEELRRGFPEARIVVLARDGDGDAIVHSFRAGAAGFVPEGLEPEEITAVLKEVGERGFALHSAVATEAVVRAIQALDRPGPPVAPASGLSALTERERQVLELLAAGRRVKSIAAELDRKPRTIESHLARIYSKLGVSGRVPAVLEYLKARGTSTPSSSAQRPAASARGS